MEKLKIVYAIIVAALVMCALAGKTNKVERFEPYKNPVTGMTITEFSEAMEQIKPQITVGPKIIGIHIQDENQITVTTGEILGPLNGTGTKMMFKKIKGKWEQTKEIRWVS